MTALPVPMTRRERRAATGPRRGAKIFKSAPSWREEHTTAVRIAALLTLIGLAYHYSLQTLIRSVQVDTPLAYLGLVPMIALALALVRRKPLPHEPAIHDRQVDYIIGIPLLVAALAINLLLPIHLSTMFWVWRVDLVSLPLFVAGAIAVVFGVRTLWRQRLPVGFLLFAWPFPYTMVLLRWLDTFTNVTLLGVNGGLHVLNIAHPLPGSDGSLFAVGSGPEQFRLSVASACSGVNGMVGFLLVSVAFTSLVVGTRWRKLVWLLSGMMCIWIMNVVRILLIFFAGNLWGESAAIDGLHPYLGLITFNLGVVFMVLGMRRFGLVFRGGTRAPVESDGVVEADGAVAPAVVKRRRAVPRTRLALATVAVFGVTLGIVNSGFRSYDLVASDLGSPKLVTFLGHPAPVDGWLATKVAEYSWSRRFFGDSSQWFRYAYSWTGAKSAAFHASAPVIADVISTGDLSSFSTYGIEACYTFHGFTLADSRTVDLGGGVVGSVLSYYNSNTRSDWTNVYWYWPVKGRDGTRYERVNLMLTDSTTASARVAAPDPSFTRRLGLELDNATRGQTRAARARRHMKLTQSFLVSYAHQLVTRQASDSRKGIFPTAAPVQRSRTVSDSATARRALER